MKIEIEVNEEKGCKECPYVRYCERFYDINIEKDGFYCSKCNKLITDSYNSMYGDIIIPDWCPFKKKS